MTLFEKYNSVVSEEVIRKVASLSEKNVGNINGAFEAIFFTMLAGLIRRANSDMSTGMLLNQVKKINSKELAVFDFANDLKNTIKLKEIVDIGDRNLSHTLPSFKSQLMSLIGRYTGISKADTLNITGFLNSLIIKFLADKLNDGSSKTDLMNYLKDHRDPLFEKAPEDFVEKMIPAMGMHELRKMKMIYSKKAEEKDQEYVESTIGQEYEEEEEEESKGSFGKVLMILAGIALLGILGYFVYESRADIEQFFNKGERNTEVVTDDLTSEIAIDSTSSQDTVVNASLDPAIIAFQEIMKQENLGEGNEFRAESLSFQPDSVQLERINPLIDTLVNRFKSNPRFQIQVRGGNKNGDKTIGIKRAFALKRYMQQGGVDPNKIDAVSDSENLDYLKIRVISK